MLPPLLAVDDIREPARLHGRMTTIPRLLAAAAASIASESAASGKTLGLIALG